jgi:hypothetical protein
VTATEYFCKIAETLHFIIKSSLSREAKRKVAVTI